MRNRSGPPGNSTVCSGNKGMLAEVALRMGTNGAPRCLLLREPLQELAVDAAETAVGHDQHVVAAGERCPERGDQLLEVLRQGRAIAEGGDRARHVPAHVRSL